MQRAPCPDSVLKQLLAITAKRVADLIEADPELKAVPDKVRALAARSGVAKTTIRAILKAERPFQADMLVKLAWTLNVPVWQLLHPLDDQPRVFEAKRGRTVTPLPEVAADGNARDLKRR